MGWPSKWLNLEHRVYHVHSFSENQTNLITWRYAHELYMSLFKPITSTVRPSLCRLYKSYYKKYVVWLNAEHNERLAYKEVLFVKSYQAN